ncbi:CPBP family intramembrane metalloprotease [Sporosarcina sp. P13]|uniref:CPBP family intramembrane glutamic endopeptidase n=1 Tax=Sporosarcina sp. P13 TaxID=2048263 RepID=UPI000C16FF11|nr:type II CAAX endopeptidase family protein [Sporosarcina sp. P13]PIC63736.1 CPBP family intramembrane metalloprotease [Sporosarcina sp. P13]
MKEDPLVAMKWTTKQLVQLLVLTLIIVPIVIEFLFHDYLLAVLGNDLYAGTITGFVMSIVFVLGVYFVALRPLHLGWGEVGLRSFPRRYWKWIIIWLIVLLAASLLIVLFMELFHIGIENAKTESLTSNMTWFTIAIAYISAAIISPIYEEIFYRGFLYKWFKHTWGVGAGIIVSSVIFTIVHIPTYNTLPVNFISGMIFAWTYEKSNSIVPAIIIHGLFNGIAVLLTVLT